ncbi:hypothetical protein QVD99_007986 [Batrachochytrium dendrobatidis]|nr:hypothetical protein O5D80_004860 [Batrachochytrium dendrobatidis]KAK5665134.1 hypothetical protein QVD99_007986 [Batrachochytrium dendrobatidis]
MMAHVNSIQLDTLESTSTVLSTRMDEIKLTQDCFSRRNTALQFHSCRQLPIELWAYIIEQVAYLPTPPALLPRYSSQYTLYSLSLVSSDLAKLVVPWLWRSPHIKSMRAAVSFYRSVICYPSTVLSHANLLTYTHQVMARNKLKSYPSALLGAAADSQLPPVISCVGPYSARGLFLFSQVHSICYINPDQISLLYMLLDKCLNLRRIPSKLWCTLSSSLYNLIASRIKSLDMIEVTDNNHNCLDEIAKAVDRANRDWVGGARSSSSAKTVLDIPDIRDLVECLLPSVRRLASLFTHFKQLDRLILEDEALLKSPEIVLQIITYFHPRLKAVKLVNSTPAGFTTATLVHLQHACAQLAYLLLKRFTFCKSFTILPFNSLKRLDLVECRFKSDQVAFAMISACPNLEAFTMQTCIIDTPISHDKHDEFFETFFTTLISNSLKLLSLSKVRTVTFNNQFATDSVPDTKSYALTLSSRAIQLLSTAAPHLRHIILDQVVYGIEQMLLLTQLFPKLYTLSIVTLSSMTINTAIEIASPLKSIRAFSLICLAVDDNESSDMLLRYLIKRFDRTLESIGISNNVSLSAVEEAVNSCKNLRSLYLPQLAKDQANISLWLQQRSVGYEFSSDCEFDF